MNSSRSAEQCKAAFRSYRCSRRHRVLTGSVKIVVKDNGRGFILNKTVGVLASEGKLGIVGMQQRAQLLNSTLYMFSEPDKGTYVSIEIKDHSRG